MFGLFSSDSSAQILAWDFQGTTSSASINATTNNSNLNTAAIARGDGLSVSSLTDAFSSSSFEGTSLAEAITKKEFLELTIVPNTNYKVSLSTLESNFRRSDTGPTKFQWQYSLNGFQTAGTNIGAEISFTSTTTNGVAMPSIDLSGINALQNVTGIITIRLYGYNASSTSGTFALGRPTSPANDLAIFGPVTLPVNLISFDVKSANGSVLLDWSTASENDNKLYTIERSEDKEIYTALGEVKGSGNSEVKHTYSFTDYTVENREYYYRLKQTDFDGTVSYSDTKAVKVSLKTDGLTVYPNPASNRINVSYATTSKEVSLKLSDITGKVRFNQSGSVESLNQKLNAIFPELQQGIYFLQLTAGDKVLTHKLVKE